MRVEKLELRVVGEDPSAAVGPGLSEPWKATLHDLQEQASSSAWRIYLEPLRPLRIAGGRLTVVGPEHAINWAALRYGELLLAAGRRRMPELRSIEFIADRSSMRPALRVGAARPVATYRHWSPTARASASTSGT